MTVNVRLASGICAGALMIAVAAAQPSAQSYKAPKTPWGDPDIQGNYEMCGVRPSHGFT